MPSFTSKFISFQKSGFFFFAGQEIVLASKLRSQVHFPVCVSSPKRYVVKYNSHGPMGPRNVHPGSEPCFICLHNYDQYDREDISVIIGM